MKMGNLNQIFFIFIFLFLSVNVYSVDTTISWSNIINGPGNGYDSASSLVIDSLGNSYVAGDITGSGGSRDVYIISYDSAGVHRWNKTISGAGNATDSGKMIKLDSLGNIYVVGYGTFDSGSQDIYIISYDSAGGYRWNKTINSLVNGNDAGISMALDSLENSYVTGYIRGTNQNFYVTSYDSNGVHRWNKTINGPGNNVDSGNSIAVDSLGNSYVTGYVTGSSSTFDIYIISYDSNGVHRWNRSIGSSVNHDMAVSIAVDSLGNNYLTGYANFNSGNQDIYVISYDSNGVHRWNRSINGAGNNSDSGNSIAVDSLGNSYLTGYVRGSNQDIYVISYDINGTHKWNNTIIGAGNGVDIGNFIAVDSLGNSYVTGYGSFDSGSLDIYVISYDINGVHRWNRSINGVGNGTDVGNFIAVDNLGNSYIAGYLVGGSGIQDFFVMKISEISNSENINSRFAFSGFYSILIFFVSILGYYIFN